MLRAGLDGLYVSTDDPDVISALPQASQPTPPQRVVSLCPSPPPPPLHPPLFSRPSLLRTRLCCACSVSSSLRAGPSLSAPGRN